ncbi:MAG: GTP-binding protein, partial [Sodaliphilus sp.]|nr:GTP-binding protein [Sodaliphilus sp.]
KGTTRDVIEDTITLGGTLFRFIDTAGIRESGDVIENMGIERSFKKLDEAQLVLWVVDPSEGADEIATFSQQILPRCEGKKLLVVVNKIDTTDQATQTEVARVIEQQISDNVEAQTIYVSARDGQNMEALNQAIIKMAALPSVADDEAVIVTNARHYEALVRAGEAITRSIDGLYSGLSGDFVSQDIRECMHYLGEITGEISTDDILGEIFSHFCIGK